MPQLPPALERRVTALRELLASLDGAVVCFSGGVDSAYLLAEAVGVLGERAVALTAVSPSLAPEEGASAQRLAEELGARHLLATTAEVDDPRYFENPPDRCYFCKTELYTVARAHADRLGYRWVLDGFNRDDRGDHRPGRRAGEEQGVRSPLDEAGFGKEDIRAAARALGLSAWDKPALACLSSRFPYGTQITAERLGRVAAAERALRELGFRVFRVRFHGEVARIEVDPTELDRMLEAETRSEVARRCREAGFGYVSVDLEGYRQGSLNETLVRIGGGSEGV